MTIPHTRFGTKPWLPVFGGSQGNPLMAPLQVHQCTTTLAHVYWTCCASKTYPVQKGGLHHLSPCSKHSHLSQKKVSWPSCSFLHVLFHMQLTLPCDCLCNAESHPHRRLHSTICGFGWVFHVLMCGGAGLNAGICVILTLCRGEIKKYFPKDYQILMGLHPTVPKVRAAQSTWIILLTLQKISTWFPLP